MDHRRGAGRVPNARPPSPLIRIAAVAVIAVLAVACDPAPTNAPTGALGTPSATSPATPTAAPSEAIVTPPPSLPPAVSAPCTAADLKASHGLIEGAAGSILTEVVLVAATTCSIDAFPLLGLRDANGTAIIGSVPTGPGRIDVSPQSTYTTGIRLANWCEAEPAFPLELVIRLGDEELVVTGGSFPEDAGGLPPCNGEGGAILEASGWVASG